MASPAVFTSSLSSVQQQKMHAKRLSHVASPKAKSKRTLHDLQALKLRHVITMKRWVFRAKRKLEVQSVQSIQSTSSESIESKDDSGSFSPKGGDFGSDSNGECGIAMVHRFRAPSNGRPNGLGWLSWF